MDISKINLNLSEQQQKLVESVLMAGETLLSYWPGNPESKNLQQSSKDDGTLVTEADIATNEILLSALRAYFPEDLIISEETGESSQQAKNTNRVWYLDPLDGTKNFAAGMDDFLILICLVVNQEVDFSIAYFPAQAELCLAVKGQGAYTSKLGKVQVNADSYQPSAINLRDMPIPSGEFLNKYHTGASQYLIATGQLAGCIYGLGHRGTPKVWDFAPFDLIITESGGTVSNQLGEKLAYQGESLQATSYVASNSIIHSDLLKLIENA